MDKCPCEKDVAVLKSKIEYYDKRFEGNGQKGFFARFIALETEHVTVMESLDKLATSYSALAQSQVVNDATEKIKAEAKNTMAKALEKFGTVIGIMGGLTGMVFLILNYLKSI